MRALKQTAGEHSQFNVFARHTHTHTHAVFRWDVDKVSTQTELHAHTRQPPHPSHPCLCWRLSAHPLTVTLRQRHIHINKETPLYPLATHQHTLKVSGPHY